MRVEDLRRYIKNTEKMVVPEKVATTTMGGALLRKLPLRLQRYIVNRGARTNPYMSFVVEPYGVFLAFEIVDTEAARATAAAGLQPVPLGDVRRHAHTTLRHHQRLQRPHERVLGKPRGVLPHRRELQDRTALVDHRRVREQHTQLRPQPGIHRPEHFAFGGHDLVRG